MVFSSLLFLFYFLSAVLLLYFLVPKKLKNALLLAASLLFYAWGEPVYVVVMIAVIAADYLFGLLIQRRKDAGNLRAARTVLVAGIVFNLAILGFFKYTNFLVGNLNAIPGVSIPLLELTLPIGVSFYTFQSMSYVIDVYRGDVKAQRNIVSFGTYVALFPQLIAGPIVQYKTIDRQLSSRGRGAPLHHGAGEKGAAGQYRWGGVVADLRDESGRRAGTDRLDRHSGFHLPDLF